MERLWEQADQLPLPVLPYGHVGVLWQLLDTVSPVFPHEIILSSPYDHQSWSQKWLACSPWIFLSRKAGDRPCA